MEKRVEISHAALQSGGIRGGSLPKVPKTTKGKVLPTIHSPMDPRIIRMPPKKKYAAGPETKSNWVRLYIWAGKVGRTSIRSPVSTSASPAHEIAG